MDSHRIRSLDGLRGIFAAVVMCGHFYLVEYHPPTTRFANVALAVQFFFILSGVALCFGSEQRFLSGELTWKAFAQQRLARLYPMHLLSMGAAGLFIAHIYGSFPSTGNIPLETVANLLLLQSMGIILGWSWNVVSWSVSVEFWIGLLVLPIAIKKLSTAQALVLAMLAYALIFLKAPGGFTSPDVRLLPGFTLAEGTCAAGLLMGLAIYRFASNLGPVKCSSITVGLLEALLLAAILAVIYIGRHGLLEIPALICMPALIYSATVSNSWFTRILSSKAFAWLGSISYSVYLMHIPLLGAMRWLGLDAIENVWIRFALFAGLTFAVSYALWRWVEMPLYKRLRQPRRQTAAPVSAGNVNDGSSASSSSSVGIPRAPEVTASRIS